MAPGTSHEGEWLINIINGQDPPTRRKPLIQKAARILRDIKSNEECFDPLVVSLGPYHHGKELLMPMENFKGVAARWFFSCSVGGKFADTTTYDMFVAEARRESSPRDCYADNFMDKYKEEDFMKMMFLDGCFILYFIHHVVEGSNDDLWKSGHLNRLLIRRDLFLLENQIPYSILKVLMSLMPEKDKSKGSKESSISSQLGAKITVFLRKMFSEKEMDGSPHKVHKVQGEEDYEPFHLLDILRFQLVGQEYTDQEKKQNEDDSSSCCGNRNWQKKKKPNRQYYFRSIMELKAQGIKLRSTGSKKLTDIRFEENLIDAHLYLPQFVVDDCSKSHVLNLIAYEMCPDGISDHSVISFVCFIDSLIDHPEDVKELRSKNILLNSLGSDKEMAELFNELAKNLTSNNRILEHVMEKIENHKNHLAKVWFAELKHTRFRSPWTVIALCAGISVIVLNLVQTICTARSYFKDK